MEKAAEIIKKIAKRIGKAIARIFLPHILIIILIVVIVAGGVYVIKEWTSNVVNNIANSFRENVTISAENGKISTTITSQELWNEMIESGYEVNRYLDKPEELAKLLKAELVTQLPDTRSNVEEEIDWDKVLKSNSKKVTEDKINVLFIGNSKTYYNELPDRFKELAESLGKEVYAVRTQEKWGGRTLNAFLDESGPSEDFKNRVSETKWDYVVLQEQTDASLNEEQFTQGAKRIIDYIKENSNEDVIPIYSAWSVLADYNEAEYDEATSICETAQSENDGEVAYIAKTLLACHSKDSSINLFTDDRHPSKEGTYLAACCIYGAIYGEKTEGASYKYNLSDENASTIQKIADETQSELSSKDTIQGIIKFKRHDSDGNEKYLTYTSPTKFNEQMRIYQNSGSEEAKEFVMTHFTLKPKTNTSSSSVINGTGSFTKYNLSDSQLKQIANLCQQEQGTAKGAAAEASLMANLFEFVGSSYGTGADGLYNYVRNGGWFAHAASHMDNGSSTDDVVEAVKAVLIQGYRTLPKYVDNHDCISDLSSHPANRSEYIQHQTVLHNVYGSVYTFYCFPDENSDPFGYNDSSNRTKYGDFCYEYGTWQPINGVEDTNLNDVHATSTSSNSTTSTSSGEVTTSVSNKIVQAAKSTPFRGAGWCLGWTDDVYEKAGLNPERLCCAHMAYDKHCVSKDKNSIPIGAAVYSTGSGTGTCPTCNRIPQHVGIYIGNGQVMDNRSSGVVTASLSDWISYYGGESSWLGWGWEDPSLKGSENSVTTTSENYTGQLDSSASGDGYPDGSYTSSSGITYKAYKQYKGSYASDPYWGGTISGWGCGPTSVAILGSGLQPDLNYTPRETAKTIREQFGNISTNENIKKLMDSMGMQTEITDNPSASTIQEQLRAGKVMVLLGKKGLGSIFPMTDGHFFTAVDINDKGEVFVINPGGSQSGPTGWYDAETVAKGCINMFTTDSGNAPRFATTNNNSSERATPGYEAIVATWTQVDKTTEYSDDGAIAAATDLNVTIENGTTYTMTTATINYEDMVQSYVMPFDLLWDFLVMGESKGFVMALADLVYGSEIEVGIYDNLKIITDTDNWSYTDVTEGKIRGRVYYGSTGTDVNHDHTYANGNPLKRTDGYIHKTVVTQNNTLVAELEKAHTWVANYDKEYTYNRMDGTDNASQATLDDQVVSNWSSASESADTCGRIQNAVNSIVDLVNNNGSADDTKITSGDVKRAVNVKTRDIRVNIVDNMIDRIDERKYTPGVPTFILKDEDPRRKSNSNPSTEEETEEEPEENEEDTEKEDTEEAEENASEENNEESVQQGEEENSQANNHQSSSQNVIKNLDNFLFIGDSRYESGTLTGNEIAKAGNNIKNVGASSSRIDEWDRIAGTGKGTIQPGTKFQKYVDITGKYSGISVQLGANSVLDNVSNSVSQMKSFVSKLKNLHPNTPIFINSCLGVNNNVNKYPVYGWNASHMQSCINDFNNQISNYCSEIDNVYYIDISKNLMDSNGLVKLEYEFDGLHISNQEAAQIYITNLKAGILGKETSSNLTYEENFVSLFNKRKYRDNKNSILSAPEWLFEMIEKNDKISNMLDLIKYLLYKASGQSFGVTDVNDILDYFNVDGMLSVSSESGIVEGSLEDKVWWALRDAGFSMEATAGVMGNIKGESNFTANSIEIGYTYEQVMTMPNKGLGMVGWTYPNERKANLVKFAKNRGKEWYDEDIQVLYLVAELTGDSSYADGYSLQGMISDNPGHGTTVAGWKNAKTPEDAAYQYCWCFERPYAWDSRRQTWAREYYEKYKNATRPVTSGGDFLAIAKRIHDMVRTERYTYQHAGTVPNMSRGVDCSGYVSTVLRDYGYTEFSNQWGTANFNAHISGSSFIGYPSWKVKPASQMQPGDILLQYGHTAIYIGNGKTYDCGSTEQIQKECSDVTWHMRGQDWVYAITVTPPGK